MKKIVLTVVAMLSMTTSTFAGNEGVNKKDAFILNENIESLTKYLNLNEQQAKDAKDIHTLLCQDLQKASEATGADRDMLIKLAFKRNYMYMHIALDFEQYSKYLRVLNATANNLGLNK